MALVAKLMKEFNRSGKIGRVRPRSSEHAKSIAENIAERATKIGVPAKKSVKRQKKR